MTKNLVLFSDGTGNSAGKLFKTNVWRLYQALDLNDPQQPTQPRQFALYDDGVGTSSFKPLAVLGGAFGVGLARNVLDLYVFLCRMYEPGDRIYVFGFSRGAFTIRVLLGLVMSQGLLRWNGSEFELQRLARDAYRAYRAERCHSLNPAVGWLRGLRNGWLGLWNGLLRRTPYAQATRVGRPDAADAVTVEFVGLWDTVDAYGLPVDELTRAIDQYIWPLTMRDYTLNPRVLRACHALALDDERNSFHPRLWNDEADAIDPKRPQRGGLPVAAHIRNERISQVWFAGVHSNVGGGYADDGLAHVALLWIMAEAEHRQLRFEPAVVDELRALADENAPLYDSRRGLGGYYRYNPRRIEQLVRTNGLRIGPVKVHESVLRRIREGHDGYAPIVLPAGFAVVTVDGNIVDADDYLRAAPTAAAAPPGQPSWVGPGSAYGRLREHVYNGVWWRRVAYFFTLGITGVLAALPLTLPGNGACSGVLCFLAAPIAALDKMLPSFAAPWTEAFASHPDVFLPLALALALGLWCGAWFDTRLLDQMRRLWYSVPVLRPGAALDLPAPAEPGPLGRLIEWLRNQPAYRAGFRLLTQALLPGVFLLGLGYAAVALVGQLTFAAQESFGAACPDAGPPVAGDGPGQTLALDTRRTCVPSGIRAEAGATYRVRLTVPAAWRWRDGDLPAGPTGLECPLHSTQALLMAAGTPLRRHWAQPWMQPMARVGRSGNDSYALVGTPHTAPRTDRCPAVDSKLQSPPAVMAEPGCPKSQPPASSGDEVLESVLVARTSGELFFYVNDGIPLPGMGDRLYANNRGCAWIEVKREQPAAPR